VIRTVKLFDFAAAAEWSNHCFMTTFLPSTFVTYYLDPSKGGVMLVFVAC